MTDSIPPNMKNTASTPDSETPIPRSPGSRSPNNDGSTSTSPIADPPPSEPTSSPAVTKLTKAGPPSQINEPFDLASITTQTPAFGFQNVVSPQSNSPVTKESPAQNVHNAEPPSLKSPIVAPPAKKPTVDSIIPPSSTRPITAPKHRSQLVSLMTPRERAAALRSPPFSSATFSGSLPVPNYLHFQGDQLASVGRILEDAASHLPIQPREFGEDVIDFTRSAIAFVANVMGAFSDLRNALKGEEGSASDNQNARGTKRRSEEADDYVKDRIVREGGIRAKRFKPTDTGDYGEELGARVDGLLAKFLGPSGLAAGSDSSSSTGSQFSLKDRAREVDSSRSRRSVEGSPFGGNSGREVDKLRPHQNSTGRLAIPHQSTERATNVLERSLLDIGSESLNRSRDSSNQSTRAANTKGGKLLEPWAATMGGIADSMSSGRIAAAGRANPSSTGSKGGTEWTNDAFKNATLALDEFEKSLRADDEELSAREPTLTSNQAPVGDVFPRIQPRLPEIEPKTIAASGKPSQEDSAETLRKAREDLLWKRVLGSHTPPSQQGSASLNQSELTTKERLSRSHHTEDFRKAAAEIENRLAGRKVADKALFEGHSASRTGRGEGMGLDDEADLEENLTEAQRRIVHDTEIGDTTKAMLLLIMQVPAGKIVSFDSIVAVVHYMTKHDCGSEAVGDKLQAEEKKRELGEEAESEPVSQRGHRPSCTCDGCIALVRNPSPTRSKLPVPSLLEQAMCPHEQFLAAILQYRGSIHSYDLKVPLHRVVWHLNRVWDIDTPKRDLIAEVEEHEELRLHEGVRPYETRMNHIFWETDFDVNCLRALDLCCKGCKCDGRDRECKAFLARINEFEDIGRNRRELPKKKKLSFEEKYYLPSEIEAQG